MGTVISLDVGSIELTYSKNDPGIDHGCLFHPSDRKQISNFDDEEVDAQEAWGFQTSLAAVLPRIELLGYTLDRARCEYEVAIEIAGRHAADYAEYEEKPYTPKSYLSFDEVLNLIRSVSASKLSTKIDDEKPRPPRCASADILKRLPWSELELYNGRATDLDMVFSESTSAEYILGGFDPYTAVRLLAENPSNLDSNVTWHYGPLVSAGWAVAEEFNASFNDRHNFLIVTEGSSDAAMIRHAIKLLRPKTQDFFRYIDMEAGYPFSGTGQLHKFIQGLIALRVPLNVVAVYDNDAEGYAAYTRTSALKLPSTYRVIILPELPGFRTFPTFGPTGNAIEDINRRAASLECYLDLTREGLPPIEVQWGAFNECVRLYQGSLKGKTQFMGDFLNYKGMPDRHGSYDLSKLEPVVDQIIDTCVNIAAQLECNKIRERRR